MHQADMVIDESVLVEIKAIERFIPVHKRPVLTYLHITGLRLGLGIFSYFPRA